MSEIRLVAMSAETRVQVSTEYCGDCDGCGWCEGSPAWTCKRCRGTGLVCSACHGTGRRHEYRYGQATKRILRIDLGPCAVCFDEPVPEDSPDV